MGFLKSWNVHKSNLYTVTCITGQLCHARSGFLFPIEIPTGDVQMAQGDIARIRCKFQGNELYEHF